jgi:hypothetical protein
MSCRPRPSSRVSNSSAWRPSGPSRSRAWGCSSRSSSPVWRPSASSSSGRALSPRRTSAGSMPRATETRKVGLIRMCSEGLTPGGGSAGVRPTASRRIPTRGLYRRSFLDVCACHRKCALICYCTLVPTPEAAVEGFFWPVSYTGRSRWLPLVHFFGPRGGGLPSRRELLGTCINSSNETAGDGLWGTSKTRISY